MITGLYSQLVPADLVVQVVHVALVYPVELQFTVNTNTACITTIMVYLQKLPSPQENPQVQRGPMKHKAVVADAAINSCSIVNLDAHTHSTCLDEDQV